MNWEKMIITDKDKEYMRMACDIAEENIENGGGPFGAVIVRNGEVIATGANTVTVDNDPTAHAEVNAIRKACRDNKYFKLRDCVVYSSCEPCPMCLSALYWAGVERIYYGNTKEDAKAIDFADDFIYDEIECEPEKRHIPSYRIVDDKCIVAFEKWAAKEDKTEY